MYVCAEKKTGTKSNAVANSILSTQRALQSVFQTEYNRPETTTQREIKFAANNNQVKQLSGLQLLANDSLQVKKLRTIQAVADSHSGQKFIQKKDLPFTNRNSNKKPVIQRTVKTSYGEFDTSIYRPYKEDQAAGAMIDLRFMPDKEFVDAGLEKIGMVQINRRFVKKGAKRSAAITKEEEKRITETGWAVDRTDWSEKGDSQGYKIRNNNPIYQSEENAPPNTDEDTQSRVAGSLADTGHETKGRGETWKKGVDKPANMYDNPKAINPAYAAYDSITDEFETAALELNTGMYLGSVRWGWQADQKNVTLNPAVIEKSSDGVPFDDFMDAAKKWNEQELHDYTHEIDDSDDSSFDKDKKSEPKLGRIKVPTIQLPIW